MALTRTPRPSVAAVETALVLPLVFLLLLAIMVGTHGVFTYHEIAHLSREGARYASVHGTRSEAVTGHTAASAAQVYEAGIRPRLMTVQADRLACEVTWVPDNKPGGKVTVRLRYTWLPVAVFQARELTSTSAAVVSW